MRRPIDGMYPIEMLGDDASLVRLQSADEVPRDVELFELGHLRQSLLDVAFAKVAQTCGVCSSDGGDRLLFC